MMKRISLICIGAAVAIIACWQLPWLVNFVRADRQHSPFIMYSSIAQQFITTDNQTSTYTDDAGNSYTHEQRDSLLPFFFWRQLMAVSRFPDSIGGRHFTPSDIQHAQFTFRSVPSDINAAYAQLYPLLESMPKHIDLELPPDVFRISGSRIEFIDMESNSINEHKSEKFTSVLQKKGFRFPAAHVAGNATARKEYDNGYLITDAAGRLFQLKMTCGRPFVRPISLADSISISHLFVTEFANRQLIGMFTDSHNHLYAIEAESYNIVKIDIPHFDPTREAISIIGNPLDWTVCLKDETHCAYYAISAANYNCLCTKQLPNTQKPFSGLHFTSTLDKFVKPRFW